MNNNDLLYNTLISFFTDNKDLILKELDDILLKNLKNIKCNKFAIINNFNDVLLKTYNKCYEKLLNYETNEISDIQINYCFLSNNILELIENFFEQEEDFKKITPLIKELTKDYTYKLQALYKVTIEHLSPSSMKIS